MEAVSYFCIAGLHEDLVEVLPYHGFPNDSFLKQLEHFTRYDWLEKQSFCFDREPYVNFSKLITRHGLCFTFNAVENMYRTDT